MEDVSTTSSLPREGEVGNQTADGSSPLVPLQKIPEPTQLFYGVCTTPLSKLCRTPATKLRINQRTRGSYLLLRTLKPTVSGKIKNEFGRNALVLVQDHDKNPFFCCLHAHVHLRSQTELEDMLPVHTVFALKEPLLLAYSEDHFAVVVGSPTDFVLVGRNHVLSKDAEDLGWREKVKDDAVLLTCKWSRIADGLFERGKFDDAADAYLFALNNCTDQNSMLILNQNLATTFLAKECYESSIKHAKNVLEVQNFNEKALYCAARANYELRDYALARPYFEALKSIFPRNKSYLAHLTRCEDRLREAGGNVDISDLYRACLTDVTTTIDHLSYWGNIDFRKGPINVRGVFAAEDMEPGSLVLVEKALVTIFEPSSSSARGTASFLRKAFRTALDNPKTMGRRLLYLPGGCNVTEGKPTTFCDEENELEPIVDVRQLDKILYRNMLKFNNNMVQNSPYSYHVYEAVSRFRHSCFSNCSFLVYKDIVVIRTCASVPKGRELFLRIYGNHLTFRQKQQEFKRCGLSCSCLLCGQDKKELAEVHDLRREIKTTFDVQLALGAGEEKLLEIVKKLEMTYTDANSLRLLLFVVYRDLAKVVDRSREDWKDKVELYVETSLQSLGLSTTYLLNLTLQDNPDISRIILLPTVLFDCAGLMVEKECFTGRLDLVRKWVKLIFILERIYRGGNVDMLMQRFLHSRILQLLLASYSKLAFRTRPLKNDLR